MKTAEELRKEIDEFADWAFQNIITKQQFKDRLISFAEQYCEGEMIKLIEWVDNLEYSYCDNAKEVVKGFLDQTNKQ